MQESSPDSKAVLGILIITVLVGLFWFFGISSHLEKETHPSGHGSEAVHEEHSAPGHE